MLFKPSYKFNIISEDNYESEMGVIHDELDRIGVSGNFESFDNAKISYEYFLVENARASVVVVHGYTEFAKKYHEIAVYFMNMGYNVFLYDQRGHGFSHRDVDDYQVIHVNRFEDYAEDLSAYIDKIVLPNSNGVPLYIYSHSMGGAVTALYLSKPEANIEKAILSAPVVRPAGIPAPSWFLRLLLRNEARKNGWNSRLKFATDFDPNAKPQNSGDGSHARFYHNLDFRIKEPRFQNSCSTNRWNFEILGVERKLMSKKVCDNIRSKLFVISAEKDSAVRVPPQKKLAKRLKCKYLCIPDAKHCLYTQRNPELEQYMNDILSFFDK